MIAKVILLACIATALGSKINYCSLSCKSWGRQFKEPNTACQRANVNCGPGPNCGDVVEPFVLSKKDQHFVLEMHNKFRSKIALGKETNKVQPKAANMLELKYNKDLEYVAQCWANSCPVPLKHDKCRKTAKFNYVGQNLYYEAIYSETAKKNLTDLIKNSVESWYSEVELMNKDWVDNDWFNNFGAGIGHYTQMVWAETSHVGCGGVYFRKDSGDPRFPYEHTFLMACNYGPGGNMGNNPVYIRGEPASQCPKGSTPNRKSGLCKM